MENKKIIWIDNLRALSCLAVVLIHCISGWLSASKPLPQYTIRWFVDCVLFQMIIRYAVPVFVMISGSLLLSKKRKLDVHKIKKYIIRMLFVILIFGLPFSLLEQISIFGLNNIGISLVVSFKNLLENKSWAIMWYVYMLIGIYMILPILKTFSNNTDRETYKFVLLLLFLVSSIIPSINYFFRLEISTFYLSNFIYIFYFLAGYYITELDINSFEKKYNIMGFVGLIGFFSLLVFYNYYYKDTMAYENVFVVLISLFLFRKASKISFFNKKSNLLAYISKYSFGIYLLHTLFLNIFNKFLGIYPDVLPTIIGEFVFLVVVTFLCLITCNILYKIPFFYKILK